MARYALAIDCNRCVGCMACNGACKMTNNVPIGSFWNKVLRIGPNEPGEGEVPSHDFYFLAGAVPALRGAGMREGVSHGRLP